MSHPMALAEAGLQVLKKLRQAGHEAYYAGGCVRDQLLGREPKDIDIATTARPAEVKQYFPRATMVGAHFGVVVVPHGGHVIEVATFRTDGSYGDGRRPDHVEFSTAAEDAQRRDFTINGLFLDPENGEVVDFVQGQQDLAAKCIRAIGVPDERFAEDHLRLLRAVRFAATLGFQIEPETWAAIGRHAPHLGKISPERIQAEFSRMLGLPHRVQAFDMLVESGLLEQFLPEILDLRGCEQPPQWHPEGDVFVHTRIMLSMLPPEASLPLVLAVLLHDIAKPATQTRDEDGRIRFNGHDALGATMAETILRRLRYDNETIDAVVSMVARHMQFVNVQDMRKATLKRFMANPHLSEELELHRVDCASSNGITENYDYLIAKQAEFANEPLIPPRLLDGRQLMSLGYTAGPSLGKLLEEIQTLQLEGGLTCADDALAWLKQNHPLP